MGARRGRKRAGSRAEGDARARDPRSPLRAGLNDRRDTRPSAIASVQVQHPGRHPAGAGLRRADQDRDAPGAARARGRDRTLRRARSAATSPATPRSRCSRTTSSRSTRWSRRRAARRAWSARACSTARRRVVASLDDAERGLQRVALTAGGAPVRTERREPRLLIAVAGDLQRRPRGRGAGGVRPARAWSTRSCARRSSSSRAVAVGRGGASACCGVGFVALLIGPLRRLRAGVERLTAGDLTARVPPTSTRRGRRADARLQRDGRVAPAEGAHPARLRPLRRATTC